MAPNIEFSIRWDPEAAGITDPALARTWSQFLLTCDGRIVTEYADREAANALQSHLFISPLPLAEWALHRWHDLLDAPREPAEGDAESRREWRRRHAWRSGREGMGFPDLTTSRRGADVVFAWQPGPPLEGVPVRFLGEGEVCVSRDAAEASLAAFIGTLAHRLQDAGDPRSLEFCGAWGRFGRMPAEERRFRSMVARLGIDAEDLSEALGRLLKAWAALGELRDVQPVFGALLDAADPDRLEADKAWAESLWARCERSKAAPKPLRDLRERLADLDPVARSRDPRPWRTGWSRAIATREASSSLGRKGRIPADTLAAFLYGECGLARAQVRTAELPEPSLDGAVAWASGKAPVFHLSSQTRENARRFRLARDLHEVLFVGDPERPYARVASSCLAGSLSEANAFAAELLAPVKTVEVLLEGSRVADEKRVISIARGLKVDEPVVRHQIRNHGLATLTPVL